MLFNVLQKNFYDAFELFEFMRLEEGEGEGRPDTIDKLKQSE